MDRARFWSLITLIDRSALGDGDEEAAIAPLTDALAKLPEAEIAGFAEQLAQVLYDLDGEAFANHAGESGGSGDGFLYARCFVVARGEQHYQRVLADPTAMPQSLDDWCESLLYVPRHAWARVTGGAAEDWDHETSVSYETGSNTAKWPTRT
jgi:Protein of unknown function (DUF4240)